MNKVIKIALADDHKLLRSGLVSILQTNTEFRVVQEAANGQELIAGLKESSPDVILLDLEMPVMSGKETLEAIREKDKSIKILILTMHQSKAFMNQMMELGANGYLIKDTDPKEVITAINKVYNSGFYFSDELSLAMLSGISNPTDTRNSSDHGLTERELDVLRLICKEMTSKEIGETLFLSPKTIEGYRKVLMEKIDARNMAGLVLFAVKHELLE